MLFCCYDLFDRVVEEAYNVNTNFSRLYYDYTYDSAGNITTIKQNSSQIAAYEYDEQGQLSKETRGGTTYWYIYDTAGNILEVSPVGLPATEAYTYSTGPWRDLLTTIKIDNTTKSISYDASGNPLNWYNGNTLTGLTWSKGRQLTSLNKGTTAISYTYDMSGIRSSKKVGSTTYNYITQNGQVVRQTWGSRILDIVYDNNGQPFALCYSTDGGANFTDYYYITNVQGDVVRLVDDEGATVANYSYDAWGKVLSVANANGGLITYTTHIANINPIRYRGYYYDTETGWYYVSSRYYDPEIGRFINADDVTMLGANGDFASVNLFAYCGNNPVARADSNGEFWHLVAGAAIGAAIAAVTSVVSQLIEYGSVDMKTTLIATGTGALSGLLTASGVGLVGQVAGGAAISMLSDAAQQKRGIEIGRQDSFSFGSVIMAGAVGGICGAISGPGASSVPGTGGQKQMVNLGVGTIKRTFNAARYGGWSAYTKEAAKAMRYYLSSTAKITANLLGRRVIFSQGVGVAYSIGKATYNRYH